MQRRIAHIITGLPTGGSQTMLAKLLTAMDSSASAAEVISLRDLGTVGAELAAAGIPVRALGMRGHPADFLAFARLVRWLRADPPRLVQTWLYHADFFGGLAARWADRPPVVWNLRQSNLDPRGTRRSTIWIARLCARLSRRIPARIICCSEASRRVHAELGYDSARMVVIPNGFDLRAFRPDPVARQAVRAELGIGATTPLIGLVARFDPQKDHRNFVEAARRLSGSRPEVHFLLCGERVDGRNSDLRAWIGDAGIEPSCHLLGLRADVSRLMAALDVATLSSFGEGFPNVLGEAMACAVPCVATDVGECASIIGETGRIVPPRNPEALATAWRELIDAGADGHRRLGEAARRRIEAEFDLPRIVARYQSLYEELAGP